MNGTFYLFAVAALVVSCGGHPRLESTAETPDSPETPPTSILGSGLEFTVDAGVITCEAYAPNPGRQVRCYAAMPAGSGRLAVTTYSEATGWASDITSHVWQPLELTTAMGTVFATDMQVSADGIEVIYTLPDGLAGSTPAKATLQIEYRAPDATIQQKPVESTFTVTAVAI